MSEKFGIIIFILCSLFLGAIYLLLMKIFSGSDFILFSVFLFVVGFIIKWFPYITELSVAGTTIKLKHDIEEAKKLLIESKIIQKTTLMHFFRQMNIWSGNNHEIIYRIKTFSPIYNEIIKSNNIVNEYKPQLTEVLMSIIYCCLAQVFSRADRNVSYPRDESFSDYQNELDKRIRDYLSQTPEEEKRNLGLKNQYVFSMLAIEFNKALLSVTTDTLPCAIPDVDYLFLNYQMPQINV
ncbi:hypothetical protein [Morganella morganii]|uniref:hypothetical protein n=1 Tax=Morganella morganii TaxID=582 RepID=UPI0023685A06|nr:hypothetical protein [Morganella morganii]